MAKHGKPRHVKRIAAPKSYPILRKTATYVFKVSPGPHSKKYSLPLAVLIRDKLKITKTKKETKSILNDGKVSVDGIVRKGLRLPIGFMDILAIPQTDIYYRAVYSKDGKLDLIKIDKKEAGVKLCKIMNKTKVRGGKIQLNLHDGKNLIVDKTEYKTGDSILLEVPGNKIKKHIPFEKDTEVYLIDGKHIGETAKIVDFHAMPGSYPDRVILLNPKGEKFETLEKYVFVIGKGKPELDIYGK